MPRLPRLTLKRNKKPKHPEAAPEETSMPMQQPTAPEALAQEPKAEVHKMPEEVSDSDAPTEDNQEKNTTNTAKENPEVLDQSDQTAVEEEPVPEFFLPNQKWEALYEAVAGLSHRDARPPLPCQDAAIAAASPRPWVMVADGAGSSAVSEIGSQAVVTGLGRLANTLEKQLSSLLDDPQAITEETARAQGLLFVKHAKGILDDLATQHRRPQKDFRCTLLFAIQGKAHLLWVKIGDGALVVEQLRKEQGQLHPELRTLGEVGKGEFANQTTFIDDHLQPSDVQVGVHPTDNLTGFAAMSDGAADRLVANDGSQVSSQVSGWLNDLRQGKLKRRTLTRLFYSDAFTRGTTGDDASIALAASGLVDTHE
ncbi:MAG: protein phosphatase 2C domain-containing protein [Marinospirillum sp.]|uniref:PP2C family serine/threonine-protein phosphatase n=1 Tax=Marinospirillum sp. TaxID=2183934 RepID=UPI0019E89219|nr:PP2C family serine/threonine-protein phosphatase [Marinospirillum sp.]MBE0508233.1 protein phosphatase 2C domain-containing protein [Marinospirillum sp.]